MSDKKRIDNLTKDCLDLLDAATELHLETENDSIRESSGEVCFSITDLIITIAKLRIAEMQSTQTTRDQSG